MKKILIVIFGFAAVLSWNACQKDKGDNPGAIPVTAKGNSSAATEAAAATCCALDPTNIVRDQGFGSIVPANLYTQPNVVNSPCNNLRPFNHPTHNNNWFASPYVNSNGVMYNTPQVPVGNCSTLPLIPGACDAGSMFFWGNRITGESVTQTGMQITTGRNYKIQFNARVRPGSVDTAYICMRFSNAVPSFNIDVRNIPTGTSIPSGSFSAPVRSTPILSQNWECYIMPVTLNANMNYNTLHIYPVNNLTANLNWAQVEIDNVQVY